MCTCGLSGEKWEKKAIHLVSSKPSEVQDIVSGVPHCQECLKQPESRLRPDESDAGGVFMNTQLKNGGSVWGRLPEDCPHLRKVQSPSQSFCVLSGEGHMGPVSRKIYREVICRSKEHQACRIFLDWSSRVARQRFAEQLRGEQQNREEGNGIIRRPVIVLS